MDQEKQTLSDLLIRKLKPGEKRSEIWDNKLPGFGIRIAPSGTKSFVLLYRLNGASRRLTLGRYPVLSLAEARERARDALNKVSHGIDPQRPKLEASSYAFDEVVEQFIRLHCQRHNRVRTRAETERILRNEFVMHWRARDLQDIRRDEVLSLLDAIVERGAPIAANSALSAIRKFFNWCLERELIQASPCSTIRKPSKPVARERVLSEEELRAVWSAAQTMYPYGALVQLLILTGARRNEVARMRWSDLDVAQATWIIPAEISKNGKAHTVPLSPRAVRCLTSLPQLHDSVFPARGNNETTFSGFSKSKRKLDQISGVANWTLHDLRRSTATHLARLGVPPHVVERILNHASGTFRGVAGVYNRFEYLPEMREALTLWSQHFSEPVAA